MPMQLFPLRLGASIVLILAVVSCSEDRTGPSPEATAPDGVTADTMLDAQAARTGIVFGSFNMPNSYLNDVHTGWMQGGPLSPENILSLALRRTRQGRPGRRQALQGQGPVRKELRRDLQFHEVEEPGETGARR